MTCRISLHDRDLKQFALAINRSMPDPVQSSTASQSWLTRSERHVGLASRRITKFTQKKTLVDQSKIGDAAEMFVTEIQEKMATLPLNSFINIDQSVVNKEIALLHGAR
ncbi:hypothetical protein OESDEN_12667 [Oesophagostomum dentatum]|uniref:Uncharacterized protein n=1 Tax=Oesophagostomum dentatum TaxID=61180 RepID=A0A0B1SVL7_OESDE|nr:hypothetical protein OESDEN_12667 [Oesophagostomum dentatum]